MEKSDRGNALGTQDEIVTIVDEYNNVIEALPRWKMRAERLPHRASYVLVFNSHEELYVQKRTPTKDVFAGYYDVAAGGVVVEGELRGGGRARNQ